MSGIVSILDKVFLYETKRRNLKQKFVFSIFDPIWRRFAEMIFSIGYFLFLIETKMFLKKQDNSISLLAVSKCSILFLIETKLKQKENADLFQQNKWH